jgi:lysozyme family protein
MADFAGAWLKTIVFEGGYSNDPDDNGGETNFGISKAAYPHLDIKRLTAEQAKEIYRRDYWDKINGDAIPDQRIAEMLFDAAVNHGVAGCKKLEQATSDSLNPDLFIAEFTLERIKRYHALCKTRPANRKFFYGWVARALNMYGR